MPTVQEIFDLATRGKPNLVFPKGRLGSIKHKLMMVFYKYSIKVVDENLTKNINDALFSITLPVPIKILEKYDVEYDSVSVTEALAQAAGGISSPNNLTKKISDAVSALSATIGAVNGLQINPFNVIHLKGAKLRKHNFRWKLHPENKDETDDIEKIIDTIRVNMHPKSEGFDVILSYPNLINFRIFGPNNPSHVFPSAPCVIDSFTVDRTGGDYPTFFAETGTPVVYQIHISVIEILPMINRRGKLNASTILL
jgi:hypothetical protein